MTNQTADIFRTLVYLWIVFEGIFLTLLYKMAWGNMKRSGIILSLHFIFLSITIFFVGLTILPVVRILDGNVYQSITPYLVIPAIPIALTLRSFRIKSLEEDMPKKPVKVIKEVTKKVKKDGK